jgi:pimeloyl-ACP methyl ester carboxylesterase/tRNA A-37 threonylcarbamoyl transferase component Bud32
MQEPEIRARSAEQGTQIGSYILERRLGSGAMGEVWLGTHVISRGVGAVKLLRVDVRDRGLLLQYFHREAQTISRLRHPHIVAVFEIGETHIVYQFVDGQDLARRMRTPMDPALALRLIRQIASALAHAHERGLVHRDVKPANILLDKHLNAYLADFGLAVADGAHPEANAGTPAYAAPEQWTGEKLTGAADQYALARTFCEMLSGSTLPNDVEINMNALPTHLPQALVEIVRRSLAQNPKERFPSLLALDEALAEVDVSAYPSPVVLAPINRSPVERPFWTKPEAMREVAPEILRADYHLGKLAADDLVSPQIVAEIRAKIGVAEFGFSLFVSSARLGPITDPSCLNRATEVVLLAHGWASTRQAWEHVAAAVCRDNAQALVLVPDLWGFGETNYLQAPTLEHMALRSLLAILQKLLTLLGLGALPRVIVGHSLSATALLLSNDDEMGAATSRVAISPVLPAYSEEYRARIRRGYRIVKTLGRIPFFHRWLVRKLASEAPSVQELRKDERERMAAVALEGHNTLSSTMFQSILKTSRFDKRGQKRIMLLLGENDPLISEAALKEALEDLKLSSAQIVNLATGGHYPHLESEAHPEWTARNIAEIVHIIGQMLLASSQVDHASIVDADTVMGGEQASGTDSTVIA